MQTKDHLKIQDATLFESTDNSSHVALHARLGTQPLNIRISSIAIDDLNQVRDAPPQQRIAFVRHNLATFVAIAQSKIDRSETATEEWHGRVAVSVPIQLNDIEKYLRETGEVLSNAAFDPSKQASQVGSDGRFGKAK